MTKEGFYARQILLGFRTIVLGLCLLIMELLSLPIFGYFQKLQVSGQGFYSNFMDYASKQPYPLMFALTSLIVVMGIVFMVLGYRGRKQDSK